jgi:predicted nucleic acid-binding protein
VGWRLFFASEKVAFVFQQCQPGQHCTRVLDHLPTDIEADDPFDAFLLTMALVGEADYLVTGDHRAGLIQRVHFNRTRIVTPAMFCELAL